MGPKEQRLHYAAPTAEHTARLSLQYAVCPVPVGCLLGACWVPVGCLLGGTPWSEAKGVAAAGAT